MRRFIKLLKWVGRSSRHLDGAWYVKIENRQKLAHFYNILIEDK